MQADFLQFAADWLWRASWQGACLVVLVGAVCLVLRRMPAKWRSAMWLVVLARLLLPIVPASPISLFNLAPAVGETAPYSGAHEPFDRNLGLNSIVATIQTADAPNRAPAASPLLTTAAPSHERSTEGMIRSLLAAAWMVGVASLVIYRLVLAVRLRRLLRSCRTVENGPALTQLNACRASLGIGRKIALVTTDRATTPAVTGMIRPRIILSTQTLATLEETELAWLFRHELAHVRRGDVAIQSLWWLACAVHWFNPLVWWAAARSRRDTELACDEAVLRAAGERQYRQYGNTLLKVAEMVVETVPASAAVSLLARKGALSARIGAIVNYRRTSWIWTLAAIAVLLGLAGTGLTDALRESVAAQQSEPGAKPTAVSSDPAKPKRTMSVQVLGPDEKPLPGAKIHAAVWTNEPFLANRDYVCDEKGTTTVELPKTIRILRLWASYPKHVALFAQWWPENQPEDPTIPAHYAFQLEKGTTIGGVVRNEEGQPIEGAKVEARLVLPSAGADTRLTRNTWLAEEESAKVTDAAGRWSLDNVPPGEDQQVLLMFNHPDYVGEYEWGGLQKEQGVSMESLREGTATIVLPRGSAVSGSVTDPEGKPVSDALVVWGDDPYLQWGSQEVRTDRHGVYRLPPRPAGTLMITVIADGWAPELKKVAATAENLPVDFPLKPGHTMRLVFVDKDGKSIPYVGVGIEGWRGAKSLYNHQHPNVVDSRIPFRADRNGVFQWTWAPDDEVTYNFGKEGFPFLQNRKFFADDQEHVITLE